MLKIHKRTEGDAIHHGINYMIEPNYFGIYIQYWFKDDLFLMKLRIRKKEYAKQCRDKKRIYFRFGKVVIPDYLNQ